MFRILLILTYFMCITVEANFESRIKLSNKGIKFISKYSNELPLQNSSVSSLFRCGKQCNENIYCRTFNYDEITFICQLYQSDLTTGNLTNSISSTSRVGYINYEQILFINYNKTCNYCQFNRYLICQNSRCQCPSSLTFWNGYLCQNKFYYGEICNSSLQCRQDFNLSCLFGSCQLNTAICKIGATPIIFDDIPNKDVNQGTIPSIYNGLSWLNANYINSTTMPGTGYVYVRGSGEYVSWFNSILTIQTLILNNTITLNSFVVAAGWSNSLVLTIDGYYYSNRLNTTTISINTYTQNLLILNWYGLNKITFTPSGSGYYDTGIDNLCITF